VYWKRYRGFESLPLRHSTRSAPLHLLMAGHPFYSSQPPQRLPSVECPEPVEGRFWVYVLMCRNGSLYTGQTSNVGGRLRLHNNGFGARHTRLLAPFRLVFVEGPLAKDTAIKRERQLKRWSRQKKLALIQGRLDDLRTFSKSRERLENG
jgi:putative endonuclease